MVASSKRLFSAKHLDSRVFPATLTGEMILFPEQNSGSYFEQQQRDTQLYQWSQALHLRPIEHVGRHLLTVGYSYARSSYEGQVRNFPCTSLASRRHAEQQHQLWGRAGFACCSKRFRFLRAGQLAGASTPDR